VSYTYLFRLAFSISPLAISRSHDRARASATFCMWKVTVSAMFRYHRREEKRKTDCEEIGMVDVRDEDEMGWVSGRNSKDGLGHEAHIGGMLLSEVKKTKKAWTETGRRDEDGQMKYMQ
jgi:hypothetical protein